jgi:hypothetical protein
MGCTILGFDRGMRCFNVFGHYFLESSAWHSHGRKISVTRATYSHDAQERLFDPLLDGCRQLLAHLSKRLRILLGPSKIKHTAVIFSFKSTSVPPMQQLYWPHIPLHRTKSLTSAQAKRSSSA